MTSSYTGSFTLGRREQFDERSRNYPVRALITPSQASKPRSYTWSCGVFLNQGNVGACVGFSWSAELAARPTVVNGITNDTGLKIYHRAQQLDEWPGESYEGSSVLAGAKAIQELGGLKEYRWGFSLEDLILAVGYKGPAVLGIPWYDTMFSPDSNGIVHAQGQVVGGHAILCNGVSVTKRLFRLHNSWGQNWGKNGDCFVPFEDMLRLLQQGGESCIPVKRSQIP